MDASVRNVVEECTKGSDDGRFTFPQVVMKLIEAGVEQYHADNGSQDGAEQEPALEVGHGAAARCRAGRRHRRGVRANERDNQGAGTP